MKVFSSGSKAWNAVLNSVTKYDYLVLLALLAEIEKHITKLEKVFIRLSFFLTLPVNPPND